MQPADKLSSDLRRAVKDSGQSLYAISKATGVSQASLSRFAAGERFLSLPAAGKVAAYLGLELRPAVVKSKGRTRQ